MVNSIVAQSDLDSEMTVVRNEFERGENSPSACCSKRMQRVAFDWHNYGKSHDRQRAPTSSTCRSRTCRLLPDVYQPDNAVLVVAGHFDGGASVWHYLRCRFGRSPRNTY